MIKQTLPLIDYDSNQHKWVLTGEKISCLPYGEMADRTMVWQSSDEDDRQYQRVKLNGKYYFIPMQMLLGDKDAA